jgi:hypothetical protein
MFVLYSNVTAMAKETMELMNGMDKPAPKYATGWAG